jgi:hypothetical protein
MMFMHSLQDRLDTSPHFQHVVTLAVDPGCVGATEIMREQNTICRAGVEIFIDFVTPALEKMFSNCIFRTPERAARDILRDAIEPYGMWRQS